MPFPVLEIFSAISTASRVAWAIYEKGLRPGIPPDHDYPQLVNAIRDFQVSLQNIQNTQGVQQIQERTRQTFGSNGNDETLQSFKRIVGDFEVTLEDCNRLVENKEHYARGRGGALTRLTWNVTAANEARELRDRIVFHHTRLNQMFQPLNISLMLSIEEAMRNGFQDMRNGFQANHNDLRLIKQALGIPTGKDASEVVAETPAMPVIPAYLRGRFDNQADRESDLIVTDEVKVSSVMGHLSDMPATAEALALSAREQTIQQYVDLMKAVWMLDKPMSGSAQAYNPQNSSPSLTAVTWKDLRKSVACKLAEFDETTGNYRKPTDEEISNSPNIQFGLWIFPPGSRPLKPKFERLTETLWQEVLLESNTPAETLQLLVAGAITDKTSVKITTNVLDSMGRIRHSDTYHIDTRRVVLLPTYAEPGAQLLNLLLRTSASSEQGAPYQFRKINDLHNFQHCLTGFEVKHDQERIAGIRYKHSGFMKVKIKHLCKPADIVRAQIWFHNPMHRQSKSSLITAGTPNGNLSPASAHRTDGSSRSRRRSQASSNISKAQTIDEWAESIAPSNNTSVTRIGRATAQEIAKPQEPRVVVLLAISSASSARSQEPGGPKTLQYLTFALRDGIYIDPSSCMCHQDEGSCPELCIKSRGTLSAKLYDFREDPSNWNIVVLGEPGHVNAGDSCRELENLDRILITFQNAVDRREFCSSMEKAILLHMKRMEDYHESVNKVVNTDLVG